MIDIQKFNNEQLGSLTTLKSHKTGKIMFVAKEIADQWGHTNVSQIIRRILGDDEKILVKKTEHPDFFKQLAANNLFTAKTQHTYLITESGLYKMILNSKLEKAKPFIDWVTKDVLPSIREKGSYSLSDMNVKDLGNQTIREVQVTNSKQINSKNYNEKGVGAVIDYNRENCKQVTGLEPNQIKKHYGYKSKSAKEILRKERPELAATMSLNDHLVTDKGAELKQLKALDEAAVKLFKEFTKLGFRLVD